MADRQRDPRKEAFWRQVLTKHSTSELNVREFCRQEGITEPKFYAWRRTIEERDRQGRDASPAFVPVVVRDDRASGADGHITIELRGGRVMRLPATVPPDRLAAILHAIEAAA